MSLKLITIAGGGLAGLSLGLALRQRGIPVKVCEAGRLPRHRVCGEFISGRGQEVLGRLGLERALFTHGAVEARNALFCFSDKKGPVHGLRQPAWCISRFRLDHLLAQELRSGSGEVLEETRLPSFGEGVVRATGRRPTTGGNRKWFGLKVHARNVPLEADLEMHVMQGAYVGLCRLADGIVNVCGLFGRSKGTVTDSTNWRDCLRGDPESLLHRRLNQACFLEETFCSVAGLNLAPERGGPSGECRLGDALTMIPPVTGNGMSLALESAWLAAGPLEAYSRGQLAWSETQQRIAATCDRAFARRLAWARLLHWALARGKVWQFAGVPLARSRWVWTTLFAKTRTAAY